MMIQEKYSGVCGLAARPGAELTETDHSAAGTQRIDEHREVKREDGRKRVNKGAEGEEKKAELMNSSWWVFLTEQVHENNERREDEEKKQRHRREK